MTANTSAREPVNLQGNLISVWRVAGAIGVVSGVLSIVLLVRQGFEIGLRAPLAAVVGLYDAVIVAMFGWADQPMQALLRWSGAWLGLDLLVYPHWKHVFVLMSAYLGLQVRINFQQRKFADAWATAFLGPLLALGASAGYGTASLAASTFVSTALLAPVLALVLYGVVVSFCTALFHPPISAPWYRIVLYYWRTEVLATVAAGGAAFVVGAWAARSALPNPTLLSLGSFILSLGFYFVGRGAYLGFTDRLASERWNERFQRSASGRFGVAFFTIMAGAALFLLLNAGLPAPSTPAH